MIDIKNLYLKYIREYYALYDINLKIEDGESVGLIGSEGSGKTTLLRVLAKLQKFDKGEIYIKDISLKKINFKDDVNLGYVSTKPVFLKNKTVYENLKYVLKNRKVSANELEKKVNDTIIEFNIEKYRDVKAKNLTLYEKYIISLIRLTLRPLDVLLVDDIFDGLTDEEKQIILGFIKENFIDKKVTTLVGSSKESLVKDICGRCIHFNTGAIEQEEE